MACYSFPCFFSEYSWVFGTFGFHVSCYQNYLKLYCRPSAIGLHQKHIQNSFIVLINAMHPTGIFALLFWFTQQTCSFYGIDIKSRFKHCLIFEFMVISEYHFWLSLPWSFVSNVSEWKKSIRISQRKTLDWKNYFLEKEHTANQHELNEWK